MSDNRAVTNNNLRECSEKSGGDLLLMPAAYIPYRALEPRIVFDAAGVATVRDMTSGDQREVPLDQLVEALL